MQRRLDADAGVAVQITHGAGEQLAGLNHRPLAGRGGVGRTGKCDDRALADAVHQDCRADRAVGADRPATVVLLGAVRLEQLADRRRGGGPIDRRGTVDQEWPVRAEESRQFAAGLTRACGLR